MDETEIFQRLKEYKGQRLLSESELRALLTKVPKLGTTKQKISRDLEKYRTSIMHLFETDPAGFYEIPSATHEAFHRSTKKYRAIVAANRTRKTTSLVQEVYWWLTRSHPFLETPKHKLNIWWVGPNYADYVDKTLYGKFIVGDPPDIFSPRFPRSNPYGFEWKNDSHQLISANGDAISFKSADKSVAMTKFASENVDLIVVDEPVRADIWGECEARLLTSRGKVIFGQTATEGLDWFYEQFVLPWRKKERDDVDMFKLSMFDCPWFTKEEIEAFIQTIRRAEGEQAVLVRVYGEHMPFSKSPVFDPKSIEYYYTIYQPPKERGEIVAPPRGTEMTFEQKADGRLRVWQRPEVGRNYVIGADPCLGQGVSKAYACVLDTDSWDVVADWHGQIDPDVFGEQILMLLGHWYNKAWVWCENNNHGQLAIHGLMNRCYPHIGAQRQDMSRVRAGQSVATRLGISTTAKSKPVIFELLRAAFRDRLFGHLPEGVLDEAKAMTLDGEEDNKVTSQTNTDRVMGLGFAVYGIHEMTNNRMAPKKQVYTDDVNGFIARFRDEAAKRAPRNWTSF